MRAFLLGAGSILEWLAKPEVLFVARARPVDPLPGLPSPEDLERYEHGCPGAAKMTLEACQKRADQDAQAETLKIQREAEYAARGQVFGLIACLSGFAAAGFAAQNGAQWIGSIVGSSTIVGLVSIFVLGRLLGDKRDIPKK